MGMLGRGDCLGRGTFDNETWRKPLAGRPVMEPVAEIAGLQTAAGTRDEEHPCCDHVKA